MVEINNYILDIIKSKMCKEKPVFIVCSLLNNLFGLNIDTTNNAPTKEQLDYFLAHLQNGKYTKEQLKTLLYNNCTIAVKSYEPVQQFTNKPMRVTEIKAGHIVYISSLQHYFLVLSVKQDACICVGLSTKPDPLGVLEIKSIHMGLSYVRLTVSKLPVSPLLNLWCGNITNSQLKLVKAFLKSHKLW